MEKLKDKWHSFKIWFCKDEVDFFLKEIDRYKFIIEQQQVEYHFLQGRFDTLNQGDVDIINNFKAQMAKQLKDFKDEQERLLFLDAEKIVTTEVITIDELGRPVQKKVLLIGGEALNPEATNILKQEVAYIKRTMWWDIVQNTVVNTAKLKMFEGSKDYADMVGGKGILYAADIYRKILDRILE